MTRNKTCFQIFAGENKFDRCLNVFKCWVIDNYKFYYHLLTYFNHLNKKYWTKVFALFIRNQIKSIMFSTLALVLGGSFLPYGPFIVGLGFVSLLCCPPNICLAFAIFNFSSGVINFFFYYGFAGGITRTGFDVDFYSGCFTGDYIFFSLY